MSEARDPAIKLFGKTIPLPESQAPPEAGEEADPAPMEEASSEDKDICRDISNIEVKDPPAGKEEDPDLCEPPDTSSGLKDSNENDPQASVKANKEIVDPKTEQPEADASGQEKVLKKPDKILPCPRCNSLDTKFCYYNNYNVNQPRHFCKNCQRYWTAGGTMRNVPVGAGRRKNKNSASHYRHIMMSSEGIPSPRSDGPDSAHSQILSSGISASARPSKATETVLKFGPEAPLCETMATVLNLRDPKLVAEMGPQPCVENGEEPSCASSVTASNVLENDISDSVCHKEQNGLPGCRNELPAMHPMQCYPGHPWTFPWGPGWNDLGAMTTGRCSSELAYGQENGNPNPIQWSPSPLMAAPPFCAPTIPFPYIPASFWGCMSNWPNGAWNMPWVGSNGFISPSSSNSIGGCSGIGSPTLGKHSRDASLQTKEKAEKSLWAPKTLRIDDPDEAAKSSIWATLGIKPDQNELNNKGGIFKAFQPKNGFKNHTPDAAQLRHANPAAMSRSQTFQEST